MRRLEAGEQVTCTAWELGLVGVELVILEPDGRVTER